MSTRRACWQPAALAGQNAPLGCALVGPRASQPYRRCCRGSVPSLRGSSTPSCCTPWQTTRSHRCKWPGLATT
eukprot:5105561-Lingulodinium_polyedra.AAC.1